MLRVPTSNGSVLRYTAGSVTEPKKQDGTIELDVGQIDLLDLPLPPSSKRSLDDDAAARGSKGPPPLPPPPPAPAEGAFESEAPTTELDPAAVAATAATQKVPVPSLPPPPGPAVTPATVSARKLVDGPSGGSPFTRLLLIAAAAVIGCVAAFFAVRAIRKTPAAPAASAAPSAAPTHAFTMAPIEFTETPGASASATASAAPEPSAKPAPSAATTTTAAPHATAHPSHTASAKPTPRPDDLIKVEN